MLLQDLVSDAVFLTVKCTRTKGLPEATACTGGHCHCHRVTVTESLVLACRYTEQYPEMQICTDCVVINDAYPKARCHALVIARTIGLNGPTDLRAEHLPLLQNMQVSKHHCKVLCTRVDHSLSVWSTCGAICSDANPCFHCTCLICFLALQASDLVLITAYFQAQLIAGQVCVVCVCQPDLKGVFFLGRTSLKNHSR